MGTATASDFIKARASLSKLFKTKLFTLKLVLKKIICKKIIYNEIIYQWEQNLGLSAKNPDNWPKSKQVQSRKFY